VGRARHRLLDPQVRETARRYRTIEIQAGDHVITAADPLPHHLRLAIDAINASS